MVWGMPSRNPQSARHPAATPSALTHGEGQATPDRQPLSAYPKKRTAGSEWYKSMVSIWLENLSCFNQKKNLDCKNTNFIRNVQINRETLCNFAGKIK
jgi:hypothetical protein